MIFNYIPGVISFLFIFVKTTNSRVLNRTLALAFLQALTTNDFGSISISAKKTQT